MTQVMYWTPRASSAGGGSVDPSQVQAIVDAQIAANADLARQEDLKVEALELVNDGDALDAGSYLADLSGGPFAVTLNHVPGCIWDFSAIGASDTNRLTIGVPTDTFNGSQMDFIVNQPDQPFRIIALDAPDTYHIVTLGSALPDMTVAPEDIKQAQNLSVGTVNFREQRDGDIVSQIDGPTTPNTVFTDLLGSQLNTDTEIMRWVAPYDGTIASIEVLIRQLQTNNAGGLAVFTVTNTASGASGNAGTNWGTQGATFGNGDVIWTLPDLSQPVPFSVGDEIVIALRVNNGNSWAILSQNLANDIAWITSAPDSPAVKLNGSVSHNSVLSKVICQETGDITYYDIDGNLVDISGLMPAPASADISGPLMIGVGPTGARNTALYLEDNGTDDRPLIVRGPDNIERSV